VINGKLKYSQAAPIGDFPVEFQALLADLKSVAEKQPLNQGIEAFLSAEPVNVQRAQSIENDPREFYQFITLDNSDLKSFPVVKNAIQFLGRFIPIRHDSELQAIEKLVEQSNLKFTDKEFFIRVEGKSYQLQLLTSN
jgi:hypothetical protein